MKLPKLYCKIFVTCFILSILVETPMNAQKTKILIGTTNKDVSESVAVCELDEEKETIAIVKKLKAGHGPGYITFLNNHLYAISTDASENNHQTLRAFRFLDSGSVEMLSEVSSKGAGPCHIATARDGKSLFTANYGSGSVAQYAIKANGGLGDNLYAEQFSGKSIDPNRQKAPHAHYINTTIDNQYVLTADLGTDKVMIHRLDGDGRMQVNESQPYLEVPPGSGPRHLEFHPNNRWIYVLNELNSTISTVQYLNGKFEVLETISTLPDDFEGTSYSAAVRLHPNGEYVYSSNRGSDSISVFEIDDNGTLTLVQNFDEALGWVRDFNVSPSGKFLVAGNERSDEVVLLKLDTQGYIQKYITSLEFPSPSCFVFY